MKPIHIFLGNDAIEHLVHYSEARNLNKFLLIADRNTYPVLGEAVETTLKSRGMDVKSIVFQEREVVPNEDFIFQVLYQADPDERTFLAVGSGTLTDITRFTSHRSGRSFISLPTAPSVDGFTSPSASLVIRNVKTTVLAQTPEAVISNLPTLTQAPQAMIAAGFGDILGKVIAQADWKLGHLVWDEPYDAQISSRVYATYYACTAAADEIGRATLSGIEKLMSSLADSGLFMLDFGNSRPASGAEHYMSHYLEMKLLREGRPAVLHGAKVALCSILAARYYEQLRQINRAEAAQRLQTSQLPDRDKEIATIQKMFGPIADKLTLEQSPFLDLTPAAYQALKQRILDQWDEIQALAALVPSPVEMEVLMRKVGGATTPAELGLSEAEVAEAREYAHFIRNRFTISKLARILNI